MQARARAFEYLRNIQFCLAEFDFIHATDFTGNGKDSRPLRQRVSLKKAFVISMRVVRDVALYRKPIGLQFAS